MVADWVAGAGVEGWVVNMAVVGWVLCGVLAFFAFRIAGEVANDAPINWYSSVLIGQAWVVSFWCYGKGLGRWE